MAAKQAVPPRRRRERPERLLERYGVRPTPQRVAVLGELIEPDDVTAQELHRRLGAAGAGSGSQRSTGRSRSFATRGSSTSSAHHPGELCYRVCPDQHHHHLVCTGCHRVVELVGCDLEPNLQQVAASHGFIATGHRLEVNGLCPVPLTPAAPRKARTARRSGGEPAIGIWQLARQARRAGAGSRSGATRYRFSSPPAAASLPTPAVGPG